MACIKFKYNSFLFFLITFLISWTFGFINAYFSYQNGMERVQILLMIPFILAPFISTLIMFWNSKSKIIIKDYLNRFGFTLIKLRFIPAIILLMPLLKTYTNLYISKDFFKHVDQAVLSTISVRESRS